MTVRVDLALFAAGLTLLATSFCGAQTDAQRATYTLKATPKTVAWGYYDAKAAPVLRVKSGDTVAIQALTIAQSDPSFAGAVQRMPRNQLRDWVGPAQPGETREVPVGGVQDAAVLDRQSGQVRVTYQWTASLAIQQHLPQQTPVLLSGWQETHVGLREPLIHNLRGFLWREPLSGESWVRGNPEEGRHRLPW